ncbi:hypothetical protein [Propionibacterium australiense]|uniref:hypothetical protein n=1 Tax=Propionibacterium australiense TaxID=119981 RepID=UPI000F8422C5|nr:hypothetical protein [Propionibacterium australiense]
MKLQVPMFHEEQMVSFLEILSHIDGRGLSWNVSNLWAQARAGSGFDVLEMERLAKLNPSPLWLTWFQLLCFGGIVEQVIDGDFAGYLTSNKIQQEPVIVITAFDSTEWSITTNESSRCDLSDSFTAFEFDDPLSRYK